MNDKISTLYRAKLPPFAPCDDAVSSRCEVFQREIADLVCAIREGKPFDDLMKGQLFFNCLELVHIISMHDVFCERPEILDEMKEACKVLSDGFARGYWK